MSTTKSRKNPAQAQIDRYFSRRPIAYQPGLSLALGSVNAGILLSQLLHWHGLGANKEGWVYKTVKECTEETGLSRTQQETVIKLLRKYQIIDYKLAGIPAKRNFRVNMAQLENVLPDLKKRAHIAYPNPPRKLDENLRTITKNTQENTTQTTSENTADVRRDSKTSVTPIENILYDHYAYLKPSKREGVGYA